MKLFAILSGPRKSVAIIVVIGVLSWLTPSNVFGQLLKRKLDVRSVVPETVEDDEQDEQDELPIWENRFFASLAVIDNAITEYESAIDEAERASNSIIRDELRSEAESDYAREVSGQRFVIHFKLSDVRSEKLHSRYKQSVSLSLREPTFPSHEYDADVTVVISPTQARNLTIGSLIRVEGKLQERDRKSFDQITFFRKPGLTPLAGDKQLSTKLASRRKSKYTFVFHVDNVRVLTGKLLEEYESFISRYQKKLDENALTNP